MPIIALDRDWIEIEGKALQPVRKVTMKPTKIIVLGHSGFIGSRLITRLAALHPSTPVIGASLTELNLEDAESAERTGQLFDPGATVVMCAAIKRQLGDTADIFLKNMAIVVNFANIVARHPVRRVVYLSSCAVYGEDIENLAITERSSLVARTYYGQSKIAAEWILERTISALPATELGILRPATIYGPGDLPTAYGPSGFLDAAVHGRPITLWGDGSELRELLFIDDVVEVAAAYVTSRHTGPLNLVAGQSYTFRDALNAVEAAVGSLPPVTERPRSKPKVDNVYDNASLRMLLPDTAFTSLRDGVRLMHASRYITA
jgi:UDP-glucose 4-epimerase